MNPEGIAIPAVPDPSKADPKVLLEQISRLNQQIVRERQESTRRFSELQNKCKAEMDKLRQTTHQHGRDLENQNSALLQSLGRLKEENDELKRQLLTMQLQNANGQPARAQAQAVDPSTTMPVVSQTPALSGEDVPLPPRS